ncbi:MAG: hypothetical protein ACRDQX_04440 [Pseudonocardiaceae bacterium]
MLLGLVAVGAYTSYSNADDTVTREANAVGVLYRDASNYPEPLRSELRTNISRYIDVVVNQEFPAAHQGKLLAAATPTATIIEAEISSFVPTNPGQTALDEETFRQFGDLINDRNSRLGLAHPAIPGELWLVLIAGAVINFALVAALGMDRLAAHFAFSGTFALLLGLILVLIVGLDQPFLGDYSISADAFERIRDVVIPQIH